MGLYPTTDFTKEGDLLVKTQNNFDGAVTKTYYQPVLEITERTNCFCCSCDDFGSSDPACRNHGYYGKRPCELHDMPGSPWEDSDEMPESVQEARKKRDAQRQH